MLFADFHAEYGLNLVEVLDGMQRGGSAYSPRLVLSLISELSFDSRFVAANRPRSSDDDSWVPWGSVTFQNQLLKTIANLTQAHMIGALSWEDGKRPSYDPITDPGDEPRPEKRPMTIDAAAAFFRGAG